jgi:hypothetical protein
MSDRMYGGIRGGGASVSVPIQLRLAASGLGATGKVASDLTASYWRQGGARVGITLADLSAITDAWASGGLKEVDATNQPGVYRLDLPDLAVVTGADWVVVSVVGASLFPWHERWNLETRRSLRRKRPFTAYSFQMRQAANPGLPATGLTVAGQRSLNGGAFGNLANAVAEIGSGWYKVDLADTDTDGDVVALKFTATGALDLGVTHVLEPSGI